MPFPYTFTFYSYKGGVGRSLALLNTAYVLSSWGRHVLIVDMDLEAPGIGGFLTRLGELSPPPAGDLVDLLTLAAKPEPGDLPPVFDFIRSVLPEKLKDMKPELGEVGRLDVLAPDTDRDYTGRLAALALQDRTRDEIIELGQTLHAYFKRQRFAYRPLGIEDFEPPIEAPYDYILVDSRTGFTEIGGLCVGPLADRLVVLTGLNDQNIHGTLHFLREVGIAPQPRPEKQSWDDADPVEGRTEIPSLGPKPTIVVASPVPSGEIEFKRERLAVLEKQVGIKPLRVSYHPRLALMETIFVRDYTDELPAVEYQRLAVRIASQVDDSPNQLARLIVGPAGSEPVKGAQALRLLAQRPELAPLIAFRALSDSGPATIWKRRIAATLTQSEANRPKILATWAASLMEEADNAGSNLRPKFLKAAAARCAEATRLKPDLAEAFCNWGNALADLAKTKSGDSADQLFIQSFEKYAEATRLKPDLAEAFSNWGNALAELAKTKSGDPAEALFAQSFEKHAEATRLKPDLANAFSNWGNALKALAKTKSGHPAEALFSQSFEKHAEATRLKPDLAEAFSNWGNALADLAKTKSGDPADQLFIQSFEKSAEATRLKPDLAEAFSNWGNALAELAKTKSGGTADQLFAQSFEKHAEATRLKPDFANAFNNWGNALKALAKTKSGHPAEALFAQSFEKYAEATRLKPALAEAFTNWGNALLDLAETKSGDPAAQLFAQSFEKYAEATRLKPDFANAFSNWGNAFTALAKTKSGDLAEALFVQSIEKYAEATRLEPDFADAFGNWGAALSHLAKTKSGDLAEALFVQSIEKYAEATRLKPDFADAFGNWGVALSHLAKTKSGDPAEALFVQSIEKYAEATRLKPDLADAFGNWGAVLFHLAKTKSGDPAEALLAQARQKLSLAGPSGLYNFACLEALGGNVSAALDRLRDLSEAGIPCTVETIEADPDFDPIRNSPEFAGFLANLRRK